LKKLLHKILLFTCIIVSGALGLSYLASNVDPNFFLLPAFFGLAYPYLLCINIIFIIYWVLRKRWSFLLPLFTILIGYNSFSLLFQLNNTEQAETKTSFRLMSYNVRFFDKYNWTGDKNTSQNIITLLKENNLDIICIQEYNESKNSKFKISKVSKTLGLQYVSKNRKNSNIVIFSKYPIVSKSEIIFPKGNFSKAIYSDIKINNDTIRVYNIHLESNRFAQKNYRFIKKREYQGDKRDLDEIKDISNKLRTGFKRRANQALILKQHMDKSPYEYIVAGDFNDTSSSFTYNTMAKNMYDSFKENGWGLGITYKGDFPSFRIDYILYSKGINCLSYKRVRKQLSDHYPIKGVYTIHKKKLSH